MNDILSISLEHKPLFEQAFHAHPPTISEHTFTNLFAWRTSRPIRALHIDHTLVIFEEYPEAIVIVGPPVGEVTPAQALELLEHVTGKSVFAFERLDEAILSKGLPERWEYKENRDQFDYVYRQESLATLAGRNLHAKRNLVTQCLQEHECHLEPITPQNLPEVRDLMERWCHARNCGHDLALCHENRAIREVLTHFESLQLLGGTVRVDGTLEAFTIAERLNRDTAVIHFEKAMPTIKGLYQVINQMFCRETLSDFTWINREQDLGIEGLRRAKESYAPDHLIKKFSVFPRGSSFANQITFSEETRCPEAEG